MKMLGFVEKGLEDMDVSENSGTPKSSILLGFSIINHPFWGTPIFGNIHMKFSGQKTFFEDSGVKVFFFKTNLFG